MKSLWTALVTAAVLVGPLVTVVRADISADEVRKAIAEGVKYLERHQHPEGGWDEFQGYTGGTNALCTLALLNAGVKADDPADDHVARALDKLAKTQTTTTYARVAANDGLLPCQLGQPGGVSAADRAERGVAAKEPAHRRGRAAGPGPMPTPKAASKATATIPTASSPCWRCTRRSGRSTPPMPPVHVSDRTWRLAKAYWEGCQNPRRLLGLLPGPGRLRQHELRGDQLADHRRRHGPPGRRQGRRRPHPVLWTRRPGKRPHRAGDHLAGEALQGDRQPWRSSGCGGSTIFTAWNAPGGLPPGGSSAATIGTARAPTAWSASRVT